MVCEERKDSPSKLDRKALTGKSSGSKHNYTPNKQSKDNHDKPWQSNMLVDSDLDEDELLDGSDDLIGCSQDSDDSDLDADGEIDEES